MADPVGDRRFPGTDPVGDRRRAYLQARANIRQARLRASPETRNANRARANLRVMHENLDQALAEVAAANKQRAIDDGWTSPTACAGCNAEVPLGKRRLCMGCCWAWYCGPACQKAHWAAGHRDECSSPGAVIARDDVSPDAADADVGGGSTKRAIRRLVHQTWRPSRQQQQDHSGLTLTFLALAAIAVRSAFAPNIVVRMEPTMVTCIEYVASEKADYVKAGARLAQAMFAAHEGIRNKWRAPLISAIDCALDVDEDDDESWDDERVVALLRQLIDAP